MKAIILAAGRWTRLKPITDTIPKPLIKIRGKSILENLLEWVYEFVSEIILIVDYKKEVIEKALWDNFLWVPITYHYQWEAKGTGAALWWIESDEDVFIAYWDSIFSKKDLRQLAELPWYGCLVLEVEHPEKYGVFSQKEDGTAIAVVEKPKEYIWNLANLWVYKFSHEILSLATQLEESPRWEYELTDSINIFCKKYPFTLLPITGFFLDISYPKDIETTEKYLQEKSLQLLQAKPTFWNTTLLNTIKGFELHFGIQETHIQKLIEYSGDLNDTALQENTGDFTRFREEEKIQAWYNIPDRYTFTLVSQKWELAGIWWARPCEMPNITEVIYEDAMEILESNSQNLHTFGIRIYPDFRGQKIASAFLNTCDMYYKDIFPHGVMSADTYEANIPMQKGFDKSGYLQVWYWKNINSNLEAGQKRFVYIKEF